MKLLDYMPKLYEDNIEMRNIIEAEQDMFELRLKISIINAFSDNFIKTATIEGIKNYENLLGIIPDETLTVEERRQQVLTVLLASVPYTYRKLCEILDTMFGPDGYHITRDINKYKMSIATDYLNESTARLVEKLLKKIIPANIEWEIQLIEPVSMTKYNGIYMHIGEYETLTVKREEV